MNMSELFDQLGPRPFEGRTPRQRAIRAEVLRLAIEKVKKVRALTREQLRLYGVLERRLNEELDACR